MYHHASPHSSPVVSPRRGSTITWVSPLFPVVSPRRGLYHPDSFPFLPRGICQEGDCTILISPFLWVTSSRGELILTFTPLLSGISLEDEGTSPLPPAPLLLSRLHRSIEPSSKDQLFWNACLQKVSTPEQRPPPAPAFGGTAHCTEWALRWRPPWRKAWAQPYSSPNNATRGQSLCRSLTAPCSEWVDHSITALTIVCENNHAEAARSGVRTGNGSGPQRTFKSCWRATLKRVHEVLWRDSHQWFLRWWLCWLLGMMNCQFVRSTGGELRNLVNRNLCRSGIGDSGVVRFLDSLLLLVVKS